MTTRIRRYVETDTGHRVPNHKSKCRHFHGHRYRFEAEIEGEIIDTPGVSEEGMLMDFSDISEILTVHIHDIVLDTFYNFPNRIWWKSVAAATKRSTRSETRRP